MAGDGVRDEPSEEEERDEGCADPRPLHSSGTRPTGNANAIWERSPSGRETTEAIEQVRASGPLPLSSPTISTTLSSNRSGTYLGWIPQP